MSSSQKPPVYVTGYNVTPDAYQPQPGVVTNLSPINEPAGTGPDPDSVPAGNRDSKDKTLKELGEVDPASLIPGKGPGGAPQQYFNLEFEDCFEEHHKTKTFPALYQVLGLVYKYTKLVLYHFFVIVVGIPLMFLWAIINGIMTFVLVWVWGPALRLFVTVIYSVAPFYYIPAQAILTPIVDVFARLFRQCVIKAKLSGSVETTKQEYIA